ncbi:dexamethasone-induced protein isoform X1 [Pogoniulus pusillus]|uniref:dexamethasone-induced protein isoform X1 n=1 Tax=Pogoniulus pusillus TaxID=488313 RepID=UPI0030B9A409
MAVAQGTPRPRDALAASRPLLRSIFLSKYAPFFWCRGELGGPGPTAACGHAEGSPGKFLKHVKWTMNTVMDQTMEGNYTLKCRDEKKDKRTRRTVIIRPCHL